MPDTPPTPDTPADTKAAAPQAMDWLRTPVTVTVPRWTLLAAGLAALVLLLIALD
jgi:hypothetical protein